jgi:hypothetical protein
MADFDVLGFILIVSAVVMGGAIFFGLPIMAWILKDKLSFWPRQKWRIIVYEAEIRDVPTGEEKPLINNDGTPILDTQGRAVTNPVYRKDIVLVDKTKPVVDGYCWVVKKKIIPWLWVNRGMLKGFYLDMTYLAYAAPVEGVGNIIRVAQLSKSVWEGGSFYPLGDPDITLLDKRHAIFTHKIDQATIDQSISAMSATAWVDFQKNRARKDESELMKILQMMAPVIIVVLVLIVAIFAFDFSSKSMDKASGLWAENARACAYGYEMLNKQTAPVNTTAPAGGIKLPFG